MSTDPDDTLCEVSAILVALALLDYQYRAREDTRSKESAMMRDGLILRNLKTVRENHTPPLTQKKLAQQADCHAQTVMHCEHGRPVTNAVAWRIRQALGVSLETLTGDTP